MKKATIILTVVAVLLCVFLVGCGNTDDGKVDDQNGGGTTMSTKAPDDNQGSNVADNVGDAVGDAGEGIGDAVSDVGDAVGDLGEGAGNAVSDAMRGDR